MKKDHLYLGLLGAALLIGGFSFLQHQYAPSHLTHQVQSGDTLHKIARRYGVDVDTLRSINGIKGDLIEVDQMLIIPPDGEVARIQPKSQKRSKKTITGGDSPLSGLSMPQAKTCLPPPDESRLGTVGMVAAVGLSAAQIKEAMVRQIPLTTACVTTLPDDQLQLNITVGCSGLVSNVGVTTNPGWNAELVECVTRVLRHTEFPAHDLPDGDSFSYPLSFNG